jgi:hypothetical protein
MSIATLKKKTASKYNNVSVNVPHFSIIGGHRNQGWVGQTSLSRSFPRSLRNGPTLRGSGGCCGTYHKQSIVSPDICCKNDAQVIKKASVSTNGMIMSKYRWIRRPSPYTSVKPGSGNILFRSQGSYIERKSKEQQCSTCKGVDKPRPEACNSCNVVPTMFDNRLNTPQSFGAPYPNPTTKTQEEIGVASSQGERITKESACCVSIDEQFLDQENQQSRCGSTNTCGA